MGRFYILALFFVGIIVAAPGIYLALSIESDGEEGLVIYHLPYLSKVRSFDSAELGDVGTTSIISNVYETLYHYHYLKRPVVLEPILAEEMPAYSSDGRTVTIKIKKGIKYAPNSCFESEQKTPYKARDVKADDFVLAFKRVADFHVNSILAWPLLGENTVVGLNDYREKTKHYSAGDFSRYDLDVEGIEALDDYTLQIKLVNPFPRLEYVLAGHFFAPTPREAIDYYLAREDDGRGGRRIIPDKQRLIRFNKPEHFVGTGPYLMTKWRQTSQIVLEKNPNYIHGFYPDEGEPGDKEGGLLDDAGKPLPFIDKAIFHYVPHDTTIWQLFLRGRFDSTGVPEKVFQQVITPDKELVEEWRDKHIILNKFTKPSLFWVAFNMRDEIVGRSKSLRQGLSLAVDVEAMCDVLFSGLGRRSVNIIPSLLPGYEIAEPSPYARYDLEAAKEKIAQAKVELGEWGLLDANGEIPELTLDLPGDQEFDRRYGEFIQQQYQQVGIRLKVNPQDWPTFQKRVQLKKMQIATMGWHADYPDAENFLQLYYSGNIDKGSNDTNYANPEFDKLYEQIQYNLDREYRLKAYAEMVRIVNEDCPMSYLREPEYFSLRYKWIKNGKPHPVGYGYLKCIRVDTELRKQLKGK